MTKVEQPPGTRGSRLLGMAPQLRRDQLSTYEHLTAPYGDVVRLVLGPPGLRRVIYLVTHPDGVEQVLAVPLSTGITLRPAGPVPCRVSARAAGYVPL
jgi:cytochrome P450